MKNAAQYRALASPCRQTAAYNPDKSWHLLGQAERWEHLAEAELASHFKECNPASLEMISSKSEAAQDVRKAVSVRMIGMVLCYAMISSPLLGHLSEASSIGSLVPAAATSGQDVPFTRDRTAERPSVTSGIGRGETGKVRTMAPVDNDKSQNSSTR